MEYIRVCCESIKNNLFYSNALPIRSAHTKSILYFHKLSENATKPSRASKLSAGYDLHSAVDLVVQSKGKALVPTDLQVKIPENCYGRIAPRSGLAHKHFIDVGG